MDEDDSIPNAIVSRFPIILSGQFRDNQAERDSVFAKISINNANIWAFSVHLPTKKDKRISITNDLMNRIFELVPQAEWGNIILGGDFNTTANDPAFESMKKRGFVIGELPTDYHGKPNTNNPRSKPYDWVLTTRFEGVIKPTNFVFMEKEFGQNGFVYDTRNFKDGEKPDDEWWRLGDSGLHQHMAVLRSFTI